MRHFYFKFFTFLSLFFLLSCQNVLYQNKTELILSLPYASSARAADSISYNYKITFEHENGNKSELSASSGNVIVLSPAEPGAYKISGLAYDADGKLCYKGECSATAISGRSVDVELTLNKVEESGQSAEEGGESEETEETEDDSDITSESLHVSAQSDALGIKFTLSYQNGDLDWNQYSTFLYEENSQVSIIVNNVPTAGNPVIYYYPFTEKGKTYNFRCRLGMSDGSCLEEYVKCSAGGGYASYLNGSSSFESYNNIEYTLSEEGLVRLSADPTCIFSNPENLTSCSIYADLYGDSTLISDKNSYTYDNWLAGMEVALSEKADLVNGSYNLWTYDPDNATKVSAYPYWLSVLCTRFSISELPDQTFRSKEIVSDMKAFNVPENFLERDHIKIEPVSDGIDVTLKWLESDGEWELWSAFEELNTRVKVDFYTGLEMPSSDNPSVQYHFPYSTAGRSYKFKCICGTKTGLYKEEYVWCKAMGGEGDFFDVELYDAIKPVVEYSSEAEEYKWYIDGDVENCISAENLAKVNNIYLIAQLYGGKVGTSDSTYLYQRDISLKTADEDIYEILRSPQSIREFNSLATYALGPYDYFYIQVGIRCSSGYADKDVFLDFTGPANYTQVENEGPRYESKLLTKVESLDNDWDLFYSCFENDFQNFTMSETDTDSCAFTLASDFDNDLFELQICRHLDSIVEAGSYIVSFDLTPSVDIDSFEYDIFDSNGTYLSGANISYTVDSGSIGANQTARMSLILDVDSTSSDIKLCLIPFLAGTYSIENIAVSSRE